jgi:site-specific recombinase XerD
MNSFAQLLQRFFAEHLLAQRNLSPHTRTAYRRTFRLLLGFLSRRQRVPVDEITFAVFTPESILAFLDHLERERGNTARTRNARLAAIRSFARYALGECSPDFLLLAQRIRAIPSKRTDKPLLGFMTRPQITAVLKAIDGTTRSGRRDQLFFTLLYNTGARVSEIIQLRVSDIQKRVVHLHGKGRKDRAVPIWPQTARRLGQWCQNQQLRPDQPVFSNRYGTSLTREGIAFRLRLAVRKAGQSCPSLQQAHITPHTFRHTAAMHLLQSGVPIEIIALWLGHAQPQTTHGYVEADLTIKQDCLDRLEDLSRQPRTRQPPPISRLLSFLETT